MGFKIASSRDCQNAQFWRISNICTRLGGFWAPKRVSKPMVFKMASFGDFQNSQFWCTSNFGTRLGVSDFWGSLLLWLKHDPKVTFVVTSRPKMPRRTSQDLNSSIRCVVVIAQPFCSQKFFWEITLNYAITRSYPKLREVTLNCAKLR